jgi:predicted outer membrane protein
MSRCLTPAVCVLLLLVSAGVRADVADKVKAMQAPKDSKEFAMKAAESGMLEVKLAQLAQQKSQSPDVKQLAKHLETDHAQASSELAAVAKQKNIDLPTELKGECMETLEAFGKLEGNDFDNAFLVHNIKGHICSIAMFQREAQLGSDADVKAWAAKTLPALKKHAAHIGSVAQGAGLPVDAVAAQPMDSGARPAGARIDGNRTGGSGTGTNGTGTSTPPRTDR